MIIYTETSGNRTVEIDITSVSHWFKPYIGWIGNANGETLTTEIRASFDEGSTWTDWSTVSNRDELTTAFNETTETHADIIEVKQTLETTDDTVSPEVECVFIYFPDFDPNIVFSLPSLEAEINVYGHVYWDETLPSLLMNMDAHNEYYDRSADLEADIPSLTASIGAGAGLISSLPALTLELEGDNGHKADLKASLPKLTSEWYAGSRIVATMPALTLSADLSKNELATISGNIPVLQFVADVIAGNMVDIDCRLPALTISMAGKSAIIAELSSALPKLTLSLAGPVGSIGDITGTLPILKSRISSSITGDNELDATLPMFTALMESGDLSGILRYVKGTVR
jgi:hypothetical protein